MCTGSSSTQRSPRTTCSSPSTRARRTRIATRFPRTTRQAPTGTTPTATRPWASRPTAAWVVPSSWRTALRWAATRSWTACSLCRTSRASLGTTWPPTRRLSQGPRRRGPGATLTTSAPWASVSALTSPTRGSATSCSATTWATPPSTGSTTPPSPCGRGSGNAGVCSTQAWVRPPWPSPSTAQRTPRQWAATSTSSPGTASTSRPRASTCPPTASSWVARA
mmetsp:Transcript_8235/g.22673  ORF Transcript_8235/g.22673 Transcript_8235/m.22673 type:complete len:222 (+) Transcript_8235:619-1284(+)